MKVQDTTGKGTQVPHKVSSSPSNSTWEKVVESAAKIARGLSPQFKPTSPSSYKKKELFEEKIRNTLKNLPEKNRYSLIKGLFSFLKKRAHELPLGIFRISPNVENLKAVLSQLVIKNKDSNEVLSKYPNDDAIHLACSSVKKIFSHLNIGGSRIAGKSLSEILANSSQDLADLKKDLPEIVKGLEEWNRLIFLMTMRCLYKISLQREKHKMDAANLAMTFAPAVLSQKSNGNNSSINSFSSVDNTVKIQGILSTIIANYPILFPKTDSKTFQPESYLKLNEVNEPSQPHFRYKVGHDRMKQRELEKSERDEAKIPKQQPSDEQVSNNRRNQEKSLAQKKEFSKETGESKPPFFSILFKRRIAKTVLASMIAFAGGFFLHEKLQLSYCYKASPEKFLGIVPSWDFLDCISVKHKNPYIITAAMLGECFFLYKTIISAIPLIRNKKTNENKSLLQFFTWSILTGISGGVATKYV